MSRRSQLNPPGMQGGIVTSRRSSARGAGPPPRRGRPRASYPPTSPHGPGVSSTSCPRICRPTNGPPQLPATIAHRAGPGRRSAPPGPHRPASRSRPEVTEAGRRAGRGRRRGRHRHRNQLTRPEVGRDRRRGARHRGRQLLPADRPPLRGDRAAAARPAPPRRRRARSCACAGGPWSPTTPSSSSGGCATTPASRAGSSGT